MLTGTITFANGPVTIESAAGDYTDYLWIDFLPSDLSISDFASAGVTWQGLTLAPGSSPPETSGTTNGSGALAGTSPEGLGHDFSVTGMTYAITFNSVELNGDQTSGLYSLFSLYVEGDSVTIGPDSSAPEPQSVALLVMAAILIVLRFGSVNPRCFTCLAALVVVIGFVSPAARADTIYSTLPGGLAGGGCCVSTIGTYPVGSGTTGVEWADMFTASADALATSVDVYVGDNTGADGELTVEIAAADGLGNPGTVLASQTITGLAVPLTYQNGIQTLTFSSGAALSAGDNYFVIFTGPNPADYDSSVYQSNSTGEEGYNSSATGGQWDVFSGAQQAFDVQGSEIPSVPEPGTVASGLAALAFLPLLRARRGRLGAVLIVAGAMSVATSAHAGTITWGTVQNETGNASDVITNGVFLESATAYTGADLTLNGVTFAHQTSFISSVGSFADGSQIQVEGTDASPVSGAGTPAGWNSSYADLVSAGYFDVGSFAVSFANGFVLGGLTVGDSYEIQLFEPYLPYVYGDNQPAAFSSTYAYPATYSGGSGLLNTGYVYSTPGSTAQYVTGTFTATATTQNVYISAWGESDSEPDTAWDAIQVRDDTTPEPGTMLLVGTGLIGLACVRRHRRSTPCPGIETRSQSAK